MCYLNHIGSLYDLIGSKVKRGDSSQVHGHPDSFLANTWKENVHFKTISSIYWNEFECAWDSLNHEWQNQK